MCSQVRDTSDSIALDLDIARDHLLDQGGQPTKLDDEDLVIGFLDISSESNTMTRLRTVDGEIPQRSAGGSLYLNI